MTPSLTVFSEGLPNYQSLLEQEYKISAENDLPSYIEVLPLIDNHFIFGQ